MSELTEAEQMRLYRRFRTLLRILTRLGLAVDAHITTVDGVGVDTFEALALEFNLPVATVKQVVVTRYQEQRAGFLFGFPYAPSAEMTDKGIVPVFEVGRSVCVNHMPYYDHAFVTPSILYTQTAGLAYLCVYNNHVLVACLANMALEEWLTGEEPVLEGGGVEIMTQTVKTKRLYVAHQPVDVPSRVVQLPLYNNPEGRRTTLDIGGLEDLFRSAFDYAFKQRYGGQISSHSKRQEIEDEIFRVAKSEVMTLTERMLTNNAA